MLVSQIYQRERVLNLKERKTYTEIAQSYSKNESSIHETGNVLLSNLRLQKL